MRSDDSKVEVLPDPASVPDGTQVVVKPTVDPELPKLNRHQRRRVDAIVRKVTKQNLKKSSRKK